MATRQSFAHRLTEFAAACFLRGKNCQKIEISTLSNEISNVAHGLLNTVVNINDPLGQEK
jgi:hypothetical protein